MNVHRAQEILAADEKIEVSLNGLSVWIDSVDAAKSMVKVHVEENPSDARIVPAQELEEVH
ncbi:MULTISPECIES: H-type small acid-soluble spore protein [Paenibacillus]|uniref:Small, acid-soluble spore protein, H family n=1 Tax=Paenibacillus whitsoniae TaxID=2496558 RepID=A0A3S0A2S2_9BACL|nr:H-type small acid-soluble spore protein [Paenibacillus whitsoniae]RTE08190.1 small, acid-soluble spore protein, H family [Paenibacillus whitsoniae]